MFTVAIVGGRTFADAAAVTHAVRRLVAKHGADLRIISGGARGADTLARLSATLLHVPFTEFPADWDRLGKSAGPVRNEQMAAEADMVIAFMDKPWATSKGTKHMVSHSRAKGLPVYVLDIHGVWHTANAQAQEG